MRIPTKQLINKIEVLSKELSPQQLSAFLDIIDAMTALVKDADALQDNNNTALPAPAAHTSIVH